MTSDRDKLVAEILALDTVTEFASEKDRIVHEARILKLEEKVKMPEFDKMTANVPYKHARKLHRLYDAELEAMYTIYNTRDQWIMVCYLEQIQIHPKPHKKKVDAVHPSWFVASGAAVVLSMLIYTIIYHK